MHLYIIILVPVVQWIAHWTSNTKVLGSNPSWDDIVIYLNSFCMSWLDKKQFLWTEIEPMPHGWKPNIANIRHSGAVLHVEYTVCNELTNSDAIKSF